MLQARSEGASLRALYDIANANALDQSARAAQQIGALSAQLSEAQASLAEMVPVAELEHARQDIAALEVSWHLATGRIMADQQEGILRAHLRQAYAWTGLVSRTELECADRDAALPGSKPHCVSLLVPSARDET